MRHRDDPGLHRGRGLHHDRGRPGPPPGPPRAGRAPGPLPKAAGDLGIIAGLGRGMPGRASPEAGGRGGRVSSLGVRGAGREPMPWLGANGLLPGRGAPGRPTGRGAGDGALAEAAGAAGASGSAGGASGSATGAFGPGLGPGLAAGAASSTGAAAGASTVGRLGGCLGRGRGSGRLGTGLRRSLLGRRGGRGVGGGSGGRSGLQLVAVLLLEAHLDGGLDSRRSRLDELTHLLELLENELALDSELLGEFVDSGLCHGGLLLLLVRDPRRRGRRTS